MVRHGHLRGLTSYYILANPNYANAFHATSFMAAQEGGDKPSYHSLAGLLKRRVGETLAGSSIRNFAKTSALEGDDAESSEK